MLFSERIQLHTARVFSARYIQNFFVHMSKATGLVSSLALLYGLSVQNGWYEEKLRGDKLPLGTDVDAAGAVHGLYREGEPGY